MKHASPLIRTLDVFDGAMVTLAMFSLNVIHPGLFLVPEESPAGATYTQDSRTSSMSSAPMFEKTSGTAV